MCSVGFLRLPKTMNRPKSARALARIAELNRWRVEQRGFNRGASEGWRARNNRKLSRLAVRPQ